MRPLAWLYIYNKSYSSQLFFCCTTESSSFVVICGLMVEIPQYIVIITHLTYIHLFIIKHCLVRIYCHEWSLFVCSDRPKKHSYFMVTLITENEQKHIYFSLLKLCNEWIRICRNLHYTCDRKKKEATPHWHVNTRPERFQIFVSFITEKASTLLSSPFVRLKKINVRVPEYVKKTHVTSSSRIWSSVTRENTVLDSITEMLWQSWSTNFIFMVNWSNHQHALSGFPNFVVLHAGL